MLLQFFLMYMQFLNPTPTPKENSHGISTNKRKKKKHILDIYNKGLFGELFMKRTFKPHSIALQPQLRFSLQEFMVQMNSEGQCSKQA